MNISLMLFSGGVLIIAIGAWFIEHTQIVAPDPLDEPAAKP